MEELFELKSFVEQGKYAEALTLIGEMEEMSRDDKINKIESFFEILLLHLIKIDAEKRTTRSWEVSIRNAIRAILRSNRRRKAGGFYLSERELLEMIEDTYEAALDRASLEAFEGMFDTVEIAKKVSEKDLKKKALKMVLEAQNQNSKGFHLPPARKAQPRWS